SVTEADAACRCADTVPLAQECEASDEAPAWSQDAAGRYELFAKASCPNCPPVKAFMKDVPMDGRSIDVDTDEGFAEAARKGVFSSPTVIIYGRDGKEAGRAHTVPELEAVFEGVLQKEPS
ncbi:MAG: hypothetical protein K2H09_07560, partial [Treponemataceae bacterium]|nr:hypothetical protein [Treponemataceae bacterium]